MHDTHSVFSMRNTPAEIPFDVGMLPHFRILLGGAVTDPISPTLTVIGIWETEWASEGAIPRLVLVPTNSKLSHRHRLTGGTDSFTLNFADLFLFR